MPRTAVTPGIAASAQLQTGALLRCESRGVDPAHLVDHRADRGGGDRRAAVGAAVVARLEHGGHLLARPARRRPGTRCRSPWPWSRRPAARSGVLETEPTTRAGEAGLHLVDHHQHAALVAERPDRPGSSRRSPGSRRPRPGRARSSRRRPWDRSPRRARRGRRRATWRNPSGIGEERLVLGRLARRGERGERAPVEAASADTTPKRPWPPNLRASLKRRLVGLGAGVAEEDLPAVAGRLGEEVVDHLGGLGGDRVGEEVRHVEQGRRLLADRRADRRVGVAERGHGEAAQEVEVALAVGVPQLACPRRARTSPAAGRRPGMNGQWSPFVVNVCALMR